MGDVWAPPGRFAWKQKRRTPAPLDEMLSEAEAAGQDWAPLREGLFESLDRFRLLVNGYKALIPKFKWR